MKPIITDIEFLQSPNGSIMYQHPDTTPEALAVKDRSIISHVLSLAGLYEGTLERLKDIYSANSGNKRYQEFRMASKFIKCNWNAYDNTPDIDSQGNAHFEFNNCPMRGECPDCNIICNPRPKTPLTQQQYKIMQGFFLGKKEETIANENFISRHTVHNHRRDALKRMKLPTFAIFIDYAHRTNLFPHERF